jgi:hypothetical protein
MRISMLLSLLARWQQGGWLCFWPAVGSTGLNCQSNPMLVRTIISEEWVMLFATGLWALLKWAVTGLTALCVKGKNWPGAPHPREKMKNTRHLQTTNKWKTRCSQQHSNFWQQPWTLWHCPLHSSGHCGKLLVWVLGVSVLSSTILFTKLADYCYYQPSPIWRIWRHKHFPKSMIRCEYTPQLLLLQP